MRIGIMLAAAVAAFAAAPSRSASTEVQAPPRAAAATLVETESFTLPNGLKVIFHIDRSDPVVAVSLNAHVGSSREEPGRSGFAHMFEHLFFLDSENLGKGGLDRLSARIGGSGANGSTSRDITDYLQTVPNDALEKMIWAEADKLGFFINTVTQAVLDKEKQVVKNERRESVDNVPYGHLFPVISDALYPADHPYSWPVVGSMRDLDAATLDDVRAFYRRWYVPNNVALVIAGDFDPTQARTWVERYFGEFRRGADVPALSPRPAALTESKRLFHEDNFAQLPQLTLAWPGVPNYHPDSFALDALERLLTDGRQAPLHAVLVDEERLTAEVQAASNRGALAGEEYLNVQAFADVDLDRVEAALQRGFARFEQNGVDPAALERAKTQLEVSAYGRIDSVLDKVSRIARFNLYTGDPDFAGREIAAIRAVTAADIRRVYERYIKGRPHVAASFVPRGKAELALANSTRAAVVEEPIVQGAEAAVDPSAQASYQRTPSTFDRTVEPPAGPRPQVRLPAVGRLAFANGLTALTIEDRELPTARFELAMDGGRLMDDLARPGTSSLLARMLTRGTRRRTPAQLEDALKSLGAEIEVEARDEHFVISGSTLARNFDATMDLVEEMLLEPRWDAGELALAKAAAISDIQDQAGNPDDIADRVFEVAVYGENHIYSRHPAGTVRSVNATTMADLQRFHADLVPNLARMRVVGAVGEAEVRTALADLGTRWRRRAVTLPSWPAPPPPDTARLLFYDLPGARQSTFAFGYPALRRADNDFYPATAMNYILGGGSFASRLTQELRESKGYTYGAGSRFSGNGRAGTFRLTSRVRANVTLEAAALARSILAAYPTTFTAADLEVTKSALTRGRARAFETGEAKLLYLAAIGDYGLPADYPTREQAILDGLTVERVRALAARYVRPDAMTYVVVGDAASQEARQRELGLGDPVRVNDLIARLSE